MPAFGKDYESARDVMSAWEEGVTFKAIRGPYLDKADWEKYGNALDHVTYCWKGITVSLETGIGGIF